MVNKTPRDYQIADLAFYMAQKRCMNLSDPGVGKTLSVCLMQYFRWTEHQHKTVWVMPKSLLAKNKEELHDCTPFVDEDVAIIDSNEVPKDAKVVLMGPRRFTILVKKLVEMGFMALDVDEIHMCFRSPDSQATQAMYSFMEKAEWFIGMTGTLVNGRMDTAYPSIHVIEPRYYWSHGHFLQYHGITDLDGKIVGWRNGEKLAFIFGKHAIRRTFEDVYGPESKVILTEAVDMAPAQREIYDKFQEQAYLELEKFFIDGSLPGVGFMRARQIMEHPSAFPDLTEPGKFVDILKGHPTAKEERIEVHLEDHARTGMPLIIFAALVPQQNRLVDLVSKHGMTVGLINGKVTGKAREQVDKDFRDGKIQVLVCSPQCASIGFNWQFWGDVEVDHIIFASMDFMDTTFLQAYRRLMRGVRKTPLRITVLEYKNSLDQRLFQIIYQKSAMANTVDPSRKVLDLSAGADFDEDNAFAGPPVRGPADRDMAVA